MKFNLKIIKLNFKNYKNLLKKKKIFQKNFNKQYILLIIFNKLEEKNENYKKENRVLKEKIFELKDEKE